MTMPPSLQVYWQRFKQLKASEQRMLLFLGVFLGVLAVYALLWSPITSFQEDQFLERERQLELLTMMQQTENQARNSVVAANAGSFDPNLLAVVTRATTAQGISPNRLQPEGDSSVSLWFDQVVFSELMRLVHDVKQTQGIDVAQMVVDRTEVPGKVRARLVLTRLTN